MTIYDITEELEPNLIKCDCGRTTYGFCECGRTHAGLDPRDNPFKTRIRNRQVAIWEDSHTPNGIEFDYYLANQDGAVFTLHPEQHHTHAQIEEAKRHIRNDRDVVGPIRVIRK